MKAYKIYDRKKRFGGICFSAEENEILQELQKAIGRIIQNATIIKNKKGYIVRNEHFTLNIYEVN